MNSGKSDVDRRKTKSSIVATVAAMPCSRAAAQNHKLHTGYYTAAHLGVNHFAAKPASCSCDDALL